MASGKWLGGGGWSGRDTAVEAVRINRPGNEAVEREGRR